MDLFKQTNIKKATTFDYNAPRFVTLNDRSHIAKILRRYARRKLKQQLNKEE
jgi:hypothetical protein